MGRARELSKLIADSSSVKIPSVTTATRPAFPDTGTLVFNTDLDKPEVYDGTAWGSVGGGATGAGGDTIFYENSQTITTDYTVPADKNAMSAGPITINSGVTVTVSAGATWTIV